MHESDKDSINELTSNLGIVDDNDGIYIAEALLRQYGICISIITTKDMCIHAYANNQRLIRFTNAGIFDITPNPSNYAGL